MVSRKFPAYYLGHHPNRNVIVCSHTASLATEFCSSARNVFNVHAPSHFGYCVASNKQSEDHWGIQDRRGKTMLGSMRAYGVGGGMLGQGAHLLIVDDPLTGDDSLSPTMRQKCKDWWKGTACDRLNPGGKSATILMAQRLNTDDLAGWLLETEGDDWEVLTLRAEFEPGDEDDGTGRKPGEFLWPWGFSIKEYHANRRGNPFWWSSKYQQRPVPRGGAMIQDVWIESNEVHYTPREADARVRFWDRAGTQDGGDWTVGILMSRKGEHFYIEDMVRGQWNATNRDRIIKQTCKEDNARYPFGVTTFGEQEPGSSGKQVAEAFERMLAPFSAHSKPSSGSKELRADGMAGAFGRGQIHVYAGPQKGQKWDWYDALVFELTTFPRGKNDDIVDACSGAYNQLFSGEGDEGGAEAMDEADVYALGVGAEYL